MAKKESLTKLEKEYIEHGYDVLPSTQEELIEHIYKTRKVDDNKLNALLDNYNSLEWRRIEIVLNIIPTPSPRPRYSIKLKGFYVKGAKDNKKFIQKVLDENNIIYTSTKLYIKTYQPTPSAMKAHEMVMAEQGLLRPMQNPDWDNLGKTYSDMLQNILFLNDNIIIDGRVEKYYSIKPRVEIAIEYLSDFDSPFNKKRVENSKLYKSIILLEEGDKDE